MLHVRTHTRRRNSPRPARAFYVLEEHVVCATMPEWSIGIIHLFVVTVWVQGAERGKKKC